MTWCPSWLSRVVRTTAPGAVLWIRFFVGAVFIGEGVLKFLRPDALGPGRFDRAGIPAPGFLATLDGLFEIACAVLIWVGLLTRLAAVPMVVDMVGALAITKLPILWGAAPLFTTERGWWDFAHESRLDLAMLCSSVFLLLVGAGVYSLDARLDRTLAAGAVTGRSGPARGPDPMARLTGGTPKPSTRPGRSPRHALAAVAIAAGMSLTAGVVAACAAPSEASAGGPGIDWEAVGRAIGRPLEKEAGGVRTAEWLRTDLHVVNAGILVNPGMELNAEASFHQTVGNRAVMIGEVTLTDREVGAVGDRLHQGGVEITALHKHLQAEAPRLWWMHFWALGDPVAIARTVHAALARTRIPLHQRLDRQPPIALPVHTLDHIIGVDGDNENGVLHYRVPVHPPVTDTRAHITLPYLMEASTLLMFQPLGHGRAAVTGDFAMTADQVNPVIATLRSHGMTIVEVHNHLLYDQPHLFYLHFWKTGQAVTLARALRAGLDQLHTRPTRP
jgi:uncharacterized membrane protein YphA (DoxX/SURF4 family)